MIMKLRAMAAGWPLTECITISGCEPDEWNQSQAVYPKRSVPLHRNTKAAKAHNDITHVSLFNR